MHGEKIIDTALAKFGRLDILINNACFDVTDEGGWDSMLETNVKGSYKVCFCRSREGRRYSLTERAH